MASDDDSNITITLAANTAGVQVALSDAIASFQRMRQEMSYVSDASKLLGDSVTQSNRSWLEAGVAAGDYQQRLTYLKDVLASTVAQQDASLVGLREETAALIEARTEKQYLADATQVFGASLAEEKLSFLLAADGATEYSARLSFLREQLSLARLEQQEMQESLGSMGSGQGLLGSFSALSGIIGGLGDMVTGPLGALGGFLSNAGSTFTALMGQQLFNTAYQGARSFFVDGLFGLNKQTEQNMYSWRYTYGQGMNPDAAMANAQAISKWSQDFSYDLPFTRQSLMTAISGAAPLGLDLNGLKQYFPVIADLAATHVNPFTGQPVDLGTAVQAIRGEMMGYSRMLKYDLNINPQDLVKYGLAWQGQGAGGHITDMTTLLPALQKYSEANGWTNIVNGKDQGAAFNTAHSTFWGEWSSFLDRIQNLELDSGGGPFKALKDGLNFVSTWMDDHKDELLHVADVFGTMLTGAVKDLGQAFGGLFDGLSRAGIGKAVMDDMTNAGRWLADPQNQQNIREFATALGQNLGNALSTLGQDFDKVTTGLGHLKDSISPSELQALKDALGLLGSIIQTSVQVIAGLADLLADYNLEMQAVGSGDVNGANYYRDRIGQDINYIFGNGPAPGPDNYTASQGVDQTSAQSGSVSVDSNGKPTGPVTVNGPTNGNTNGNQTAQSPNAASDLAAAVAKMSVLMNNPGNTGLASTYGPEIDALLADMAKNGNPFAPTTDPKKVAAEQQVLKDLQYIQSHPHDATGDQKAYRDLILNLNIADPTIASSAGVGPNAFTLLFNDLHTVLTAMEKTATGETMPHASAGPAAQLVQTLHAGLGGDTGHQMGSDFVQNLASGMQTRLPIVASTSKTIGTNIAQQVMEGAMQHLGVGSGGGGVSGIGPGSTLADLVKWTVAEALQTSGNGVWSDGHTPGGFNRWGTYGFN